jgi:uncharacterized surface protein with fasciclin (FAS1) repeats
MFFTAWATARPVQNRGHVRKESVQMANLVDTLQAEGTFATFTRALNMTELAATLKEPGAFTVFAPTDAAFAQMNAESLDELFSDYYDLSMVVKYHIVMGVYKAADLLDVVFLKTMEGQRLTIRSSVSEGPETEKLEEGSDAHSYVIKDTLTTTMLESIKVNGATITRANMSADNGIIHVINKVLVPHFMVL